MPLPDPQPLFNRYLSQTFADISTASSVYFAAPARGKIKQIVLSLLNAITAADSVVTFKINGVTGTGSVTVAFAGSGVGSSFVLTPTALNAVKPGDIVEVATDGASSTTCITPCTLVIEERTL
jgi:hypothetical protein